MKVLAEKDGYVLKQESDEIRALGLFVMLGGLARVYAEEALFLFTDRVRQHIETQQYGFVYKKLEGDKLEGEIPVGFVTWAQLSAPCAVMFEQRLRPLHGNELKSGPQFWMIDICAPLGHGQLTLDLLEALPETPAEYYATRYRDGKLRTVTFKVRK
jgi:hemolysin-activating ACP:hemolysin acyltransferase